MKHLVIVEPTSARPYSNLVLLNKFYSWLESLAWAKFKKSFIKKELKEKGKLVCAYCGRENLTEVGPITNIATVDHVIPRSKGGKDEFSNVVVCCFGCNKSKSDQSVEDFKSSKYLIRKLSGT